MADQIKKLSAGHSIEVLDAIMTEVEEARGEHDNLGERLDEMSSDTPTPSTAAPAMDGTAAAGTSTDYARADHVHPSDTSKQDTLNAAQLAAVNSGITSADVEQIESNKNNISKALTLEKGVFIQSGADLDTYTTIGVYCAEDINIARSLTNSPVSTSTGSPFRLEVMENNTSSRLIQKIYEPAMDNTTFNVYIRACTISGWSSWYKVSLTAV